MCPATHINSGSWLRSSSTQEPCVARAHLFLQAPWDRADGTPFPHLQSGIAVSQGTACPLPTGTPTSHSLALPGAASPPQALLPPSFFCPSPETASQKCPSSSFALLSFPKTSFSFSLRQIIQLKKSPSIKTCLTSSRLSKTTTFSPL